MSDDNQTQPNPIPVRVVRQQGQAALIEWQDLLGDTVRGVVPSISLIHYPDGQTHADVEGATLYGVDFAGLELPTITPGDIAQMLHARDLWTADDIMKRRGDLLAALEQIKAAYTKAIIQYSGGNHNG